MPGVRRSRIARSMLIAAVACSAIGCASAEKAAYVRHLSARLHPVWVAGDAAPDDPAVAALGALPAVVHPRVGDTDPGLAGLSRPYAWRAGRRGLPAPAR